MDERTLQLNETELARLEVLAGRLSEDDLGLQVAHGWTVAVVLAHLAFWDRLDAVLLRRWARGKAPPIEPVWWAAAVNESMAAEWALVPVGEVGGLAVAAARDVDAVVADVTEAVVPEMREREEMWWVRRYLHRREHLGAIEALLSIR